MSTRTALDAYLGWIQMQHGEGCAKPSWEVDVRIESDRHRSVNGGAEHGCANESCEHTGRYSETTVRVLCRSCGRVFLISGEGESHGSTSTAAIGYGQAPRKVGGLWLYPGPPLLYALNKEPSGYLCALEKVDRLTAKDIVGAIGEGRTPRGRTVWSAGALPDIQPSAFGNPTPHFTYTVVSGDTRFNSVTAAAKWVKTAVDAAAESENDTRTTTETANQPEGTISR